MLDIQEVREAYFNPPPDNPGRPLTREEIYAAYERRRVQACIAMGFDPQDRGLGEHGSLIGGHGKPLTIHGALPEKALPLHPLPLEWFDHPHARLKIPPLGGEDGALKFFAGLSAGYLAGYPDRPSGEQLRHLFQAQTVNRVEQSQVWHVFACMRTFDIPRLRWRGGLSAYEIGRAALLADTRRATAIRYLYQYALDPEDRSSPQVSNEGGGY